MDYLKNPYMFFKHLIALPLVWMFLPFLIILDILAEIYHRICFPLYRMPYVPRKNYIKIDRHKLQYLNLFQKTCCVYCGYANGLLAYWVALAASTEKYWCGILHAQSKTFQVPKHHKKFNFAKYNSQEDFEKKYKN